ncbi:MBL fold metallo-hydrolase [Bordetella genomosp. 13]|uniref:MBL fold metallo-hydrolase n=1 Tax=Bordetella genomosp. 13 TaxID=463040 RepID=UPI00119EF2F2|nr:MBL fold metallo-hydrolase [Bordetella genomosp. 13]
MGACLPSFLRTERPPAGYPDSPQSAEGRFRNPKPRPAMGLAGFMGLLWDVLFNKPSTTVPSAALPVQALTRADLLAAPDRSLFRLGHSTVLLKLRGGFWITDPVFAQRASPFQWMGPKRFHAPPIALDDLPPLAGVILSHDHYDHLDHDAVRRLADKADVFLTPLGVGDRLVAWGVPAGKVRQLDWWQETEAGGLRLALTPSQHFSGRGLFDGDRTLWASWVLIDPASQSRPEFRLYFSGDTGYFGGFKEIGQRYGPFDVTLVENGAYNDRWRFVHMVPEETVQAHLDLRGRWLLPIHNGTFDLAMHAWHEPLDRVARIAAQRAVPLLTPAIGARVDLTAPAATTAWWQAAADHPHPIL